MVLTNIEEFFSNDYTEARAKFIKNAQENNFETEEFILNNFKAPNGDYLSINIAKSKSNFENTIIVISGTHGPEGYCGSAVQTGILSSGEYKEFTQNSNLILIHALNPYGFAWDLRFNEDNIDLNRNFISDFNNLPSSDEYDTIASYAAPDLYESNALENSIKKLFEYAANNGFDALQNALTKGQFKHQDGIYFGGKTASWSHMILINYLHKNCSDLKNLCIIDIHTGLGKYGTSEIILDFPQETKCFRTAYEIWGEEVKSTTNGNSVSAKVYGSIDTKVCSLFEKQNAVFIALEFGTIDPISVLAAAQKAAWLYKTNNRENPKYTNYRNDSKLAFYPQEYEWKAKVYNKAINVINKAAQFYKKLR